MKYTKTKEVRFNLGNFEHAVVSVGLEVDSGDFPEGTDVPAAINHALDRWIQQDVLKLSKINAPLKDGEESILEHWEEQDIG